LPSKPKSKLKPNGKQHSTSQQHGAPALHERGAITASNTAVLSSEETGETN